MDTKKVGVVCITAVLAIEIIKSHEENIPHKHIEFEQRVHSRMIQIIGMLWAFQHFLNLQFKL